MSVLTQLVYISEPVLDVRIAISDFVPLAQEKNKKFDITGLIISGENFYLQVVEGERENLNNLYKNIIKDNRHHHCTLLRYSEIKSRDFPSWSMAYTTIEELRNTYLDVIVPPEMLNYKKMTGVNAMAMLRRISAHLHYIESMPLIPHRNS